MSGSLSFPPNITHLLDKIPPYSDVPRNDWCLSTQESEIFRFFQQAVHGLDTPILHNAALAAIEKNPAMLLCMQKDPFRGALEILSQEEIQRVFLPIVQNPAQHHLFAAFPTSAKTEEVWSQSVRQNPRRWASAPDWIQANWAKLPDMRQILIRYVQEDGMHAYKQLPVILQRERDVCIACASSACTHANDWGTELFPLCVNDLELMLASIKGGRGIRALDEVLDDPNHPLSSDWQSFWMEAAQVPNNFAHLQWLAAKHPISEKLLEDTVIQTVSVCRGGVSASTDTKISVEQTVDLRYLPQLGNNQDFWKRAIIANDEVTVFLPKPLAQDRAFLKELVIVRPSSLQYMLTHFAKSLSWEAVWEPFIEFLMETGTLQKHPEHILYLLTPQAIEYANRYGYITDSEASYLPFRKKLIFPLGDRCPAIFPLLPAAYREWV